MNEVSTHNRQPKKTKNLTYISPNHQNSDSRITLKELIVAGVLPVPLKMRKTYKGNVFQASITPEGIIEFEINGGLQHFDSPSAAAVAATNRAQNGWVWWNIEGKPDNVTLDFYRRKLIR